MNLLMQLPLQMMAPEASAQSQAGGIMAFAPLLIMILIFYFLIMRPQNKKQKETEKMLKALKKGDKVTTIGGIRGTIEGVKDDVVSVRVDGNTKIDFLRTAVSSVVSATADSGNVAEKKDKKEEK